MHVDSDPEFQKPSEGQTLKTIWRHVSKDLKKEVSKENYHQFLADLRLQELGKTEAVVFAPGSGYGLWVEANFKENILSSIQKQFPEIQVIRVEHADEEVPFPVKSSKSKSRGKSKAKGKSKERKKRTAAGKRKARVLAESISDEKLLAKGKAAGLVERNQFESFVPGENSEAALVGATRVVEVPGKSYQPLFLYSDCGLGKTHLLHSIGWESLRLRPRSRVVFITAESFTNDYVEALHTNSLAAFRKKFRGLDLLLLDDVHFFGNKEGLQEEFVHTYNSITDRGGQVVLASECPANDIRFLEKRLVSRFQSGLCVEILRPGRETRVAILKKKRDDQKIKISDEMIDAIVDRVRGSVRVLEGALTTVSIRTDFMEEEVDDVRLDEILAEHAESIDSVVHVGVEEIQQAVAEHFEIDEDALLGRGRTKKVATARQIAMYLIREMTGMSYSEIGSCFGRDHGTIMYAYKKFQKEMISSSSTKSTVELIRRRLVRGGASVESRRAKRGRRSAGAAKSALDGNKYREKYSG